VRCPTPKAFANFSFGLLQPQETVVNWSETLKALAKGSKGIVGSRTLSALQVVAALYLG
jgi:hypothetical protein